MRSFYKWVARLSCVLLLSMSLTGCASQEGAQETMHATVGPWKTAQTLTPYFYQDYTDMTIEVKPFTNPGDQKTALLAGGLDPDTDVKIVRVDFFDMGQALAGGQIDAFLSGEPYPTQAMQDGYGRILEYPYFDDSIGTINAAMIVTEDIIEQRPELVQKLVDAHVQAIQNMIDHPDDWLDLAASMGTDRELLTASADNIELCWQIDEAYIEHTERLAEQMQALGLIDTVPDIQDMFDLSFLENAA